MKVLIICGVLFTAMAPLSAEAGGYCDPIHFKDRVSIAPFCSPVTNYGARRHRGDGYYQQGRGNWNATIIVVSPARPRHRHRRDQAEWGMKSPTSVACSGRPRGYPFKCGEASPTGLCMCP